MLRHHHGREDDLDPTATLEVFDVRGFDEPTETRLAPAPLACRWHLWHHWALVRVDPRTAYVACGACGRLHAPTLFELPVQ